MSQKEDELAAIQYRAEKIQQLVHIFLPKALEAIEDHHQIQQRAQNTHTIDDTVLVPGTTVYLKVEGTLGKLDSRYRGPYKIHKQVNLLVAILKIIYPRHKIKDEIEDDHVESLKDSGPS